MVIFVFFFVLCFASLQLVTAARFFDNLYYGFTIGNQLLHQKTLREREREREANEDAKRVKEIHK